MNWQKGCFKSITSNGFSSEQGDFIESSKRVAPRKGSKTVLDSGFHATDSGFRVGDFRLCQRNLDSGFQSLRWAGSGLLVGFRILWAIFRIPKPRIADSTCKFFSDSGFHKQKLPAFRIRDSVTLGEAGLWNNEPLRSPDPQPTNAMWRKTSKGNCFVTYYCHLNESICCQSLPMLQTIEVRDIGR